MLKAVELQKREVITLGNYTGVILLSMYMHWNRHPNSKVHGSNMWPIWGRQDPDGPHVGPMNFAIWEVIIMINWSILTLCLPSISIEGLKPQLQELFPFRVLVIYIVVPICGPSGADRTQVGSMLAPWTLLSGIIAELWGWNMGQQMSTKYYQWQLSCYMQDHITTNRAVSSTWMKYILQLFANCCFIMCLIFGGNTCFVLPTDISQSKRLTTSHGPL